jgi:hypothetical protein
MNRWEINKDSVMIMTQFNQIKNKENEMVSEFSDIFDNLHGQILKDLCPYEPIAGILYVNSFEGNFGIILRDKNPTTLAQAK